MRTSFCRYALQFINIPIFLTSLLTPWSRVLLEKLTGFQLVKKFPAFYGTWRFITTFTSARHLSLSWASPVHTPTSNLPEIHLNIILPSMPGSPKWSLSLRFPHQNPVYASPLPHSCYMPAHLILLNLSPEQYWVSSTDLNIPITVIHTHPYLLKLLALGTEN